MSRWKLILLLGVAIGLITAQPEVSRAQAPAIVSREIRIQTQVLATHTVVIDDKGVVREIISNSTESQQAELRVYVDTVAKVNQRPVTPEIAQQYKIIMQSAPKRIGVLYHNPPLNTDILQALQPNKKTRPVNPIALAFISR